MRSWSGWLSSSIPHHSALTVRRPPPLYARVPRVYLAKSELELFETDYLEDAPLFSGNTEPFTLCWRGCPPTVMRNGDAEEIVTLNMDLKRHYDNSTELIWPKAVESIHRLSTNGVLYTDDNIIADLTPCRSVQHIPYVVLRSTTLAASQRYMNLDA